MYILDILRFVVSIVLSAMLGAPVCLNVGDPETSRGRKADVVAYEWCADTLSLLLPHARYDPRRQHRSTREPRDDRRHF